MAVYKIICPYCGNDNLKVTEVEVIECKRCSEVFEQKDARIDIIYEQAF